MISEEELDDLMTEAINDLAADDINAGVRSLEELAHIYARAGMEQQSFANIRQFIINEAIAKTDAYFIEENLKAAERTNSIKRMGNYGTSKEAAAH